jgi:hypothetical protein
MSSKALSDTIRQVRKARTALNEVEEQLYEYLEDKYEIKEELVDVLEMIVENIDHFDDVSAIETLLVACATKPAPTRHRKNAGKKTKEEVIQTVKERRATVSASSSGEKSPDQDPTA